MQLIIIKVSVVFVYLLIGYICNKLRVVPIEAYKYMTSLILNVTAPCLMVASVTQQELKSGMLGNTIIAFLISAVGFFILIPVTMWIARRFRGLEHRDDANVLAVGMTASNCGFMGMPIAQSVFGNPLFYYFVIQNAAYNLYMFSGSIMHLHLGEESSHSRRRSLKETLCQMVNITNIALIFAIILLFAGLHLPDYIFGIVDTIGDTTIPLSMIMVGVQLAECDLKKILSNRRLYFVSFAKLIMIPALVLLVVWFLPIDRTIKLSTILIVAFPTAVISAAIAEQEGKNSKLMAEVVASTTFLSIITLSLWILFLSYLFD